MRIAAYKWLCVEAFPDDARGITLRSAFDAHLWTRGTNVANYPPSEENLWGFNAYHSAVRARWSGGTTARSSSASSASAPWRCSSTAGAQRRPRLSRSTSAAFHASLATGKGLTPVIQRAAQRHLRCPGLPVDAAVAAGNAAVGAAREPLPPRRRSRGRPRRLTPQLDDEFGSNFAAELWCRGWDSNPYKVALTSPSS